MVEMMSEEYIMILERGIDCAFDPRLMLTPGARVLTPLVAKKDARAKSAEDHRGGVRYVLADAHLAARA
jgi:hypothetical protein